MRWIKWVIGLLIVAYLLLCAGVYSLQEQVIFRSEGLPETYRFAEGQEVEIPLPDGERLNCLWLKDIGSSGVILYLHGNKGSNRRCLHQARTFQGLGYDVFMPDYRGYGKSRGKNSSESQLLADVQEVYDFLREHYPESSIILAGYSLGSGMAAWLASRNHPQQLLLIAPYTSLLDLKNRLLPIVPDFLLKYPLRTDRFLAEVSVPVSLIHGTMDNVIPFRSAQVLHQLYPDYSRLIPVAGADHRRVIFSELLRSEVARAIASKQELPEATPNK